MDLITVVKIAVVCGAILGDEKPSDSKASFCLVNYEVAQVAPSIGLYACTREHKAQVDSVFVADHLADVRRAYCMVPEKAKPQLQKERATLEGEGYAKVAIMKGEI